MPSAPTADLVVLPLALILVTGWKVMSAPAPSVILRRDGGSACKVSAMLQRRWFPLPCPLPLRTLHHLRSMPSTLTSLNSPTYTPPFSYWAAPLLRSRSAAARGWAGDTRKLHRDGCHLWLPARPPCYPHPWALSSFQSPSYFTPRTNVILPVPSRLSYRHRPSYRSPLAQVCTPRPCRSLPSVSPCRSH